jgi:hypothetical protein
MAIFNSYVKLPEGSPKVFFSCCLHACQMFPSSSQASSRPACRLKAPLVQVGSCSSWHWEFWCETSCKLTSWEELGYFFMDMIWLVMTLTKNNDLSSGPRFFIDHTQLKLPLCSKNSIGSLKFSPQGCSPSHTLRLWMKRSVFPQLEWFRTYRFNM